MIELKRAQVPLRARRERGADYVWQITGQANVPNNVIELKRA